jgi:GNAT superfamily N-acetyltransferase
MARPVRTKPTPIDLAASSIEILPLTPDRWLDVTSLFDEGGDPKSCSCMFWRVRSRDWSLANASEARKGLHALVDADRDPAPGLLAYADGRPVGWVSVAPREDYDRLTNSRIRPRIDDTPVWSIVCFVVSRSARGQGLTTRLLDAARTMRPSAALMSWRRIRSTSATPALRPRSAIPACFPPSLPPASGWSTRSTHRSRQSAE